jgi:hypothetical protein
MASNYKFHDGVGEIVPFNARYTYPSQANKTVKHSIKIPPKNGSVFTNTSTNLIRIEFPAAGYLNTLNSQLLFDVEILGHADTRGCRFNNGIQSIFKRVRLLYGSLVLEDITDYNLIYRMLIEHTSSNCIDNIDQNSILEGIGGIMADPREFQTNIALPTVVTYTPYNVRYTAIQGFDGTLPYSGVGLNPRTYSVSLLLGMFIQAKLIPLKFMAGQIVIEIELEESLKCMTWSRTPTTVPYYQVTNVNFCTEILEFDGSYDMAFLEGLRNGGVPIKFSTWHSYMKKLSATTNFVGTISERSRSVKALFALLKMPPDVSWDNGFTTCNTGAASATIESFQWRIGGNYYPDQPVICARNGASTGMAEAYIELQKALNIVSENTQTNTNVFKWNSSNCIDCSGGGLPITLNSTSKQFTTHTYGGANFVIATDLETANGVDLSGLNAEEKNDIQLTITFTGAQDATGSVIVLTYCDMLLILKEGNIVDLIQ